MSVRQEADAEVNRGRVGYGGISFLSLSPLFSSLSLLVSQGLKAISHKIKRGSLGEPISTLK